MTPIRYRSLTKACRERSLNKTTNFIKTVVFGKTIVFEEKNLHATLLNVVLHEVKQL